MAGTLLSAALTVVVVVVGVFCPTHILASSSYQSLSHHHTHTSHHPHNLHSKSSALDVFPEMKFHDGRKDHKKHHSRVDTSFSYSVAPQPVQDTPEVAMARRQFLHIYNSIRDAITAAQHRHNATTSSHHHSNHHHRDREHKQSKPRQLYDHEHQIHRDREHEHDDSRLLYDHEYYHRQIVDSSSTTSRPLFLPHPAAAAVMKNNSIFPNPKLEPEYFLPSIHLDPLLVQRLDPPLPLDAHVQQIRSLEFNNTRGTCYEIVLLEPQLKVQPCSRRCGTVVSEPAIANE
ncbi:hypothetical protein Pcinc_022848 [Petrolisthes cinctipes]|uniref:Uncharacterized protein n=1 Tax=Petrolisthes cinctipes TaxID=88211 RepID=A0AAE1FH00_PETCI|nr:hypothetical protein Pcinc_022848 [Petrolisthes cinctipes]